MGQFTSVIFFKFKKNKFWAFKQMAFSNKHLYNNSGLIFHKHLGTGSGSGFSLWPDFSTYAILTVWSNEKYYSDFLNNNNWLKKYTAKSSFTRTLILNPYFTKGLWDGINPFENNLNKDTLKKKVVVITRAKIRFSKLIQFWLSVPKASRAILKSKGVLFYKGIGELPFIHQATLSIWENQFDINQFAYSKKNHSDIIKKTRSNNWYREDMFTRFYLISDTNKTN